MYKPTVKPRDERLREVAMRADEATSASRLRPEYKFRSGKEELPLITLSANDLVYRLENYRTRDQQLTLIAEDKVPAGFFDATRREDVSVQKAQHELLLEQAKRGSGGSIKAIYDELERVQEQTEHLIITRDAVVVNGNRRLAAMRELLAQDGETYRSFAHVICAVLPLSATPEEILELEIGLQMQPDTKLPYEWTAIGRAARDLRLAGCDDPKIARLMNRSIADVQRAITMIDVADIYLAEWLSRPNTYSLLEGSEQAFIQVATRNWGKDDYPQLREVTRKFDFFVIEHRDKITQRAYELINNIELNPADFLNQVALEWDIAVPDKAASASDALEISFDDPQSPSKDYGPLVKTLADARNDKEDALARMSSLAQVCEIVGEQNKEKGRAALKFARTAYKALMAIDIHTADAVTFSDLFSLLKSCEDHCGELNAIIETRRAR